MMIKKRIALRTGVPQRFRSVSSEYREGSLTLVSFVIKDDRVEWIVSTDRGEIVEGRTKGERSIPLWPNAWIALAIPIRVHLKNNGLAPDFIVNIPGSVLEAN